MSDALKIGIAGLGTVGASLVRILQERHEALATTCGRAIEITAVTARDRNRDRGVDLSAMQWHDDALSLAQTADIDVFVELMGGAGEPAYSAVKAALSRGLHVVTANKALLAAHGIELAGLAEEHGALLNYEAAVAGGIPVIKALRESLTGNTISRVYGIMNGTCNYILTKMEKEGLSFEACLKEAQRLGYAEADPAFDIEGNDTAHKLAILTSLAYGTAIAADDIYLEGITNISIDDIHAAADLGYRNIRRDDRLPGGGCFQHNIRHRLVAARHDEDIEGGDGLGTAEGRGQADAVLQAALGDGLAHLALAFARADHDQLRLGQAGGGVAKGFDQPFGRLLMRQPADEAEHEGFGRDAEGGAHRLCHVERQRCDAVDDDR